MKNYRYVGVIFAAVICLQVTAVARFVSEWVSNPQEVFNRSDLVVVASPLSSTNCGPATNTIMAGDEAMSPMWRTWWLAVIPVNTAFETSAVLKGSLETNRLIVFHYSWNPNAKDCPIVIHDALHLVSFTNHLAYPDGGSAIVYFRSPSYLLFLKRQKDGRYMPTTGQIDPIYSVQLLASPEHFEELVDDFLKLQGKRNRTTR